MKIITIAREYGAGGHTIGRELAKRLGVEFYDRDVIKETAKASGLQVEAVEEEDEAFTRRERLLHAITPMSFDIKDTVFGYMSDAIVELAKKGPCVILGHCSGAVLNEAGIESVNVYLHADEKFRADYAAKTLEIEDPVQVLKTIHKIDSARKAYYNYYTGCQWGEAANYTISLDTSVIPADTCVDIIASIATADEEATPVE